MQDEVLPAVVNDWTHQLIGRSCWGVAVGGCVGDSFDLKFSRRVRRSRPLLNHQLSREQREFDGEFAIYSADADWTIAVLRTAVPSATSPTATRSVQIDPVTVLRQLPGTTVCEAEFAPLTNELRIKFVSKTCHTILQLNLHDSDSEYSLIDPDKILTVSKPGLQVEARGSI